MKARQASLAATFLALVSVAALAEDWPTWRHDLARSGVTGEKLPSPLHRQWVHVAAHKPMPAWPEPGRELNRLAFDYAYVPTVANGLVFYGSSADHKVYALDLASGRVRWSFFTGAPVRFAPEVAGERVFVASDDGWLYCLSAAEGRLLWSFRAAPRSKMLLGNERMISRWPLRSGVAVRDGMVYLTSGMWPAEGVYVYALDAKTGEIVWENATSGSLYLKQPHPGSFSMTGVCPQGYLLAWDDLLFVPTGRNVPAAFDRKTGKLLYYRSQPTSWGNRWGGTWAFLADGVLFNWRCHIGPDIDVQLGEYPPDKDDGIVCFDARTGKEVREFPGKLDAVVHNGTLYASGGGKITAYDLKGWLKGAKTPKWETPHARCYALILAGDTLYAGGKDTVAAISASDGKLLWRDKVEGQARALAVAGGRLLASTSEGRLVCYGPQSVATPPTVSARRQAPSSLADASEGAAALARRILDQTGKREGLALVLGADDGKLVYQLAKCSKLTLYCLEPSARRVAELREAFDAAGLYGTRVTLHRGSPRRLPYPDFFADLIVLGSGSSRRLRRCSAEELYRVLRPCGGAAWLPAARRAGLSLRAVGRLVERMATLGASWAMPPDAVARWLRRGGVPEAEMRLCEDAVVVVRGKLPETDDWTHQYANAARTGASNDRRLRLPLRLLWFGKPGPARLVARHWGGPAPLCVDGRMFVPGQFSLVAVDAYNGRQLWRRDFPHVARWHVRVKGGSVVADHDAVYLAQEKSCLRLDPATGKTLGTYPLPTQPPGIAPNEAKNMVWNYLAVTDDLILGSMGDGKEARAVFACAKDGKLLWGWPAAGRVNNNSISTDSRRVYVIDRTDPAAVARAKRRGAKIPAAWRLVALEARSGKPAWETADGIAGRTELWLSDGVLVATSPGGFSGYDAATGKLLYDRKASLRRFPVIANGVIYAEPLAYDLRTGEPRHRENPFTGQPVAWEFRKSYGCGSFSGAPNLLMFRSGALGFYDLAGDGGVFNFGGIRAGCYVNAIAANGLVLVPPADAACTCSYNFRTTVALAPAERRTQWSIFYDRLPRSAVRRAAFNLGAPGDRRGPEGTMWLALPRPQTRSRRKGIVEEPFRFSFRPGFGPYRRGEGLVEIRGTDRPWLYTCGVKGLERAEFDLAVLDRGYAAWPAPQPPKLDGRLDDPAWQAARSYTLDGGKAAVFFTSDDRNLYVSYRRPASGAWKAKQQGDDAEVWRDDSFELYLSPLPDGDRPSERCLHLGLSASGARYDAAWVYRSPFPTCDIPRLHQVAVDGKPDDWAQNGLGVASLPAAGGMLRPAQNFDAALRVGWSDAGLALLVVVSDDKLAEARNPSRLWEGDSVEVFLNPHPGTEGGYQIVISPGLDPKHPKPRLSFYAPRGSAPRGLQARVAATKTQGGYILEALLPWKNIGLKPAEGKTIGAQVFVNDADTPGGSAKTFTVMLHPGGHPFNTHDPRAYLPLRLAAAAGKHIVFKRTPKPGKNGLYAVARPSPYPLTVPPLGASGEDPAFSLTWNAAMRADKDAFVAEVAIPWAALEKAGMGKKGLMLSFAGRGPLTRPPKLGRGYERLILVPPELAKPRRLKVRLHFAELGDVRRGQRVFDVRIQGKPVLEGFDVVRAAHGPNRAVVREFDGIMATNSLVLELVPRAERLTGATAPILSAIELAPSEEN